MPKFEPGQSGNPNGRPKKEWTWAGLIEQFADEIDDNDPNKKVKVKESITKAILKKAKEGDVQAFKELANRTDGMPKETKDVKVSLPKPILDLPNINNEDN